MRPVADATQSRAFHTTADGAVRSARKWLRSAPTAYSPAIGVKLISTPWTDQNLEHAEGITAEQLRQEHRNKGMPDDLANILELAGQADVRILILDADAPALLGLPLAEG